MELSLPQVLLQVKFRSREGVSGFTLDLPLCFTAYDWASNTYAKTLEVTETWDRGLQRQTSDLTGAVFG